jgi:hypothetical protein
MASETSASLDGRRGGPDNPSRPAEATPAIESRGLAIYPRPGASRSEMAELMERAAQTGFNFIVLKVLAGGRFYGTNEAWARAVRRGAAEETSAIVRVLEAAQKLDLPVYAGVELLEHRQRPGAPNLLARRFPDWFIPERWEPAANLARQELSRPSAEGRFDAFRWLCPVHPDARRFLGDLLVETMESQAFEGLFLDSLSLPAATNALHPQEFFPDAAARAKCPAPFESAAEPVSPEVWNAWAAESVVALMNYLRARVYKVRADVAIIAEIRGTPPPEPLDPPAWVADPPARRLDLEWKQALDLTLNALALSYDIAAGSDLPQLRADLESLGDDAPAAPVLHLLNDHIPEAPFETLRTLSVVGFMIDAGRPLNEEQWAGMAKICAGSAARLHSDPASALDALQRQTLDLLPAGHELAEFLQAMTELVKKAEPEHMEQARLNLARNLKGLLGERRAQLNLPAEVEARVLRNLGLMIRLHMMLASRGELLKPSLYRYT